MIYMHFIEEWFHLAPDNGDGTLEACLIASAVAVVLAWLVRKRVRVAVRRLKEKSGGFRSGV